MIQNATKKYDINPEAELQGAAILTLAQTQTLYDFEDLVEKYGFNNVLPNEWYSWQHIMAFLKELDERHNNTENMVAIGIKVFDVLPLPENVTTIVDGLEMMNVIATMTQRHVVVACPMYDITLEQE